MDQLIVLALAGLLVPKEDKPRDYITDTPPEGATGYAVPASAYYLRRIADGDLVEVKDAPADGPAAELPAPTQPKKKG